MDSLAALRRMVKHYPGSYEAMGAVLGISPEVLRKQLSGTQGFKLGVQDAELISEACARVRSEHCHAYANAVAAMHGGFVELPVRDSGRLPLQAGFAGVVKQASEVLSDGLAALADNVVSDNEARVLRADIADLVAQAQELDRRVVEAHQVSKPRSTT